MATSIFLYLAFGDLFWHPQCATAAYFYKPSSLRRMKPPASFAETQRF